MASIAFPVDRAYFRQNESHVETLFLTAGHDNWMSHIQEHLKVPLLVARTDRFVMSALGFKEGNDLFTPNELQIRTSLSTLGIDPDQPEMLCANMKTWMYEKTQVIIQFPLKIYHVVKSSPEDVIHQIFTKSQSMAFHIQLLPLSLEASPQIALKAPDPLDKVRQFLTHPNQAHIDYTTNYTSGSAKFITKTFFKKIFCDLSSKTDVLVDFATSSMNLQTIKGASQTQYILHRSKSDVRIFALFDEKHWKGSYKIVLPVILVSPTPVLLGVSVSSDLAEAKQELFFRKHPEISKTLTSLHLYWESPDQANFIHGWANKGTLKDALKTPFSIEERDSLVIQFLEKMAIFHDHALHGDINSMNALVNRTSSGLTLYINDVGSSSLKNNPTGSKTIATNCYNLSPEIIKVCQPSHGYHWNYIFETELSFEQRMLGERFTCGRIALEIYLGKDPFRALQNEDVIRTMFPLIDTSFMVLRTQYAQCYQLDCYLNSTEKPRLRLFYKEAFDRYMSTPITSVYNALSDFIISATYTPALDTLSGISHKFSDYFENPDLRAKLEAYLSAENSLEVEDIYRSAYRRMQETFISTAYGDLAKVIALSDQRLEQMRPSLGLLDGGRLETLLPLIDLDPAKRPDLRTIVAALKEKII
jgi:hypothetical protein